MNKLKPFLIGSLAGCALMFVSLQFHLIRSEDGFRMVPRTPQPSLGLFWVDLRDWTAEDFADRPEVVRALAAHGSTDLVATSVADSLLYDVSDAASPLDQVRESMNGPFPASNLQIPETVPRTDADAANEFRDLLKRGFDQDTGRLDSGRLAATEDLQPTRSTVSGRDLPSMDSRFGIDRQSRTTDSGSDWTEPLDPFRGTRKPAFSDPTSSEQTPFTANEESDLISEMLFGDDVTSTGNEGRSDGWSDTMAESRDRIMGDVRSEVASRAGQMADDFRSQFQRTQQQAYDQTLESVEDYSARKLQESLPGSVNRFLNSTPAALPTNGNSLPPELKALQDGFDPFLK